MDEVKKLDIKKYSLDDILVSAKKHYNSLRSFAVKHKKNMPDGSIDKGWLEDVSKGDDVWGKRARMYLTIKEMHKDSETDNTKRTPEEK